jgi:hypothetical protein
MQITATSSIHAITPIDRTVATNTQAQAQAQANAQASAAAASKVKAADQTTTAPKVFTPAPPLRPNVQDFVDIDRTLIKLREGA